MKKKIFIIIILFIITFISGCFKNKENHQLTIDLGGGEFYDSERELYLPVPVKNNSIFTGWRYTNVNIDNEIIPLVDYFDDSKKGTFSVQNFKSYSNNSQISIVPSWSEIEYQNFFIYDYLESSDSYQISINSLFKNYPREITIPDTYNGKMVTKVKDNGFRDLKELVIINLGMNIKSIGNMAFANTSLYKINLNKEIKVSSNAFLNTIYEDENELTLSRGFSKKRIEIGDNVYNLNCTLIDSKFVLEEFQLFLPVPLKENMIFSGWSNTNKDIVKLKNGVSGMVLDLDDLFYNKTLKAEWIPFSSDEFSYEEIGDGYLIGLNVVEYPRFLKINEIYNNKKILGIKANGFSNLVELAKIILPNSITHINDNAFFSASDVVKLYEVNMPLSLNSIGENAFYNTYISQITLPKELTSLGANSFRSTLIKKINIPNSLNDISLSAFRNCIDLEFEVLNTHKTFAINPVGGEHFLYSKDEKTVLFASKRYTINIISGVEVIGKEVFKDTSINRLSLANTIKVIEENAFENAIINDLVGISQSKLEEIKDYAFFNFKTNKTSLSFPTSLKKIGKYAFDKSNIYLYHFNVGLEYIDDYAFYSLDTSWLNSPKEVIDSKINIPSTVTHIGKYALNWIDEIHFDGFYNITDYLIDERSIEKEFNKERFIYILDKHESMQDKLLQFSKDKLTIVEKKSDVS